MTDLRPYLAEIPAASVYAAFVAMFGILCWGFAG